MPLYEFVCEKCRKGFEVLARSATDRARACPHCGSARVIKKFSRFAATAHGGHDHHDAPACSGDPSSCGRCGDDE